MQKLTIRLFVPLVLFLTLGLLFVLHPILAHAQAGPPPEEQSATLPGPTTMPVPPFAPGVVLVGVRADSVAAVGTADAWGGVEVQAVEPLDVRGAELVTETQSGPLVGFKLKVPAGTEWDAIKALKARSDVLFAEPDRLAQIATQSADSTPQASAETPFAVSDTLYPDQWYLQRIGMSRGWSVAEEASGENLHTVHVFLLDTGSDLSNPDLVDKLAPGSNYVVAPQETACPVDNPQDDNGHGTHVSGLIAAALNGAGIVGPGLKAEITPFKVLDCHGTGFVSVIGQAIRDAADQGADIINLSLTIDVDTFELRSAAAYAVSKGVLLIVASGNGGQFGNPVSYPAAYPSVMAVGATSYFDAVAFYSNGGANLDIVAPGGLSGAMILSTWPQPNVHSPNGLACTSGQEQHVDGSFYCEEEGTSMSTGIASGVAALVMSLRPDLDADEVQQILLETAFPIAGTSDQIGHGRLDAAKAIRMAVKPSLVIADDAAHASVTQGSAPFTVTVSLTNPSLTPLDVELTPTVTTTWYALAGPHIGQVTNDTPFATQLVFTPTAAGVGTFTSSIQVTATLGGNQTSVYIINVELDVQAVTSGTAHTYLTWVSSGPITFAWAEPNFTPRITRAIDSHGSIVVDLPFTMTVGDNEFTDLRIYADGFAVASASAVPSNLPNHCFANEIYPPYTVAGWWSNLSVGVDSALSTFQPDADHFVIEYDKFAAASNEDPAESVTFQIVLDRNGQVQLNYDQVPKESPANLTIGASIEDGRFYNQITCQVPGTIQTGVAPASQQSFLLDNKELY